MFQATNQLCMFINYGALQSFPLVFVDPKKGGESLLH